MRLGPVFVSNWDWWKFMWRSRDRYGIFRNRPSVKPGRWGFYVLGFEFGSRSPGDWFGVWLKRVGLWPF